MDNHLLTRKLNRKTVFFYLIIALLFLFEFSFIRHSIFQPFYDWQTSELAPSYKFGFIKRGFLGSFLLLIKKIFVLDNSTSIVAVQLFGEILLIISLSIFLICLMRKIKIDKVYFVVIVFLSMHLLGFYYFDWGELDVYLIPITIIALTCILFDKFVWFVPFLVCIGVIIHEGYVLMYLGVILSCLLYKSIIDVSSRRKYFIVIFITVLSSLLLFVYFYFFSGMVVPLDRIEFLDYAKSLIGPEVRIQELVYSYWGENMSPDPLWVDGHYTTAFSIRLFSVVITLVMCLPLLIYYVKFWHILINRRKLNVFLGYFIALLPCFMIVPMILFQTDQGRWFYDVVFSLFFIVFIVLLSDSKNAVYAIDCIVQLKPMEILFAIMYFVVFMFPDKQCISIINFYLYNTIFNLGYI